jgi:hypothetical protein
METLPESEIEPELEDEPESEIEHELEDDLITDLENQLNKEKDLNDVLIKQLEKLQNILDTQNIINILLICYNTIITLNFIFFKII